MTHTADMPRSAVQKVFFSNSGNHGILGMWVFLTGDAVVFLILLLSYAFMRYSIPDWPESSAVLDISSALAMTSFLLGGSAAVAKALGAIRVDRPRVMRKYLALAVLGGILFLGFQAYEWGHLEDLGFTPDINPYGASQFSGMFYIITGFHGFHVLAGVVYLLVIVLLNGRYTAQNHDGVTMAGLYWHFVDLLWVLIFSTLYIF